MALEALGLLCARLTRVWSPVPEDNGTIVISDAHYSGVFVNTMLGDSTEWRYKLTGARDAHSRALAIWNGQPHKLDIISGAGFNDGRNNITNPLTLNVSDPDRLVRADSLRRVWHVCRCTTILT